MGNVLSGAAKAILSPILRRLDKSPEILREIEKNRMLIVQPRIREFHSTKEPLRLAEAEFQVFSQWGEDGIIQYLLSRIAVENKVFVELGVGNYRESNTRFLLQNNNWRGLVVDCDRESVARIRTMELFWRHDLRAVRAFISGDNVASLLKDAGVTGDIGLLSIDVDGNDYWIWKAIPAEVIYPRIVIVEYNSLFGRRFPVVVPYAADFTRAKAHYSGLYCGASLKALCLLARQKGYLFAGSNSAGSNAFFVRADVAGQVPEVECEVGYVESKVRDSRDEKGKLSFVSGPDRLKLIENEIVLNVETGQTMRVGELQT